MSKLRQRQSNTTYRRRRILLAATVTVIVVVSAVLVTLSPIALRGIASLPGINWPQLSNVGQTYGAVSALLAAFALSGVAVSILFQARDVRHNRIQASRTRQFELVRLGLEDPFYSRAFFSSAKSDTDIYRLRLFLNLYVQYLHALWNFDDITEGELRYALADIFKTDVGYGFWEAAGSNYRTNISRTGREKEFNRITDDVHRQTRPLIHVEGLDSSAQHSRIDSAARTSGIVATAFLAGVAAGRVARKTRVSR